MTIINRFEDMLDVRDIIDVVENDELSEEGLVELSDLLAELAGNGGDHQWQGVRYPVTLILDSYFENYAQQLAEDIGAIPDDAQWPANCIDWERAARELQVDYTSVEYDGITFWYR